MTRSEMIQELVSAARRCGLSGGPLREFQYRLSGTATAVLAEAVECHAGGRSVAASDRGEGVMALPDKAFCGEVVEAAGLISNERPGGELRAARYFGLLFAGGHFIVREWPRGVEIPFEAKLPEGLGEQLGGKVLTWFHGKTCRGVAERGKWLVASFDGGQFWLPYTPQSVYFNSLGGAEGFEGSPLSKCVAHRPAILHRSGGADARLENVCGVCGEKIRRVSEAVPWGSI